jgi:8-oxo-dGTP pyrophosphatase MutT (NUDIX family)
MAHSVHKNKNPLLKKKIRVLALGVFRSGSRILAGEGYDALKDEHFFRPLGGAIEFGESSLDALRREIREEIQAEITNIRYLGMFENIFTFEGRPGHEIILIFNAEFADRSLYQKTLITGMEDDEMPVRAVWLDLSQPANANYPLYPEGLRELILNAPQ